MSRSSSVTTSVRRKATKSKSRKTQHNNDEGALLTGEKGLSQGMPDFANPSPQTMLQMQRLVGNRAASQVIQPKTTHTAGCGCPTCAGGVQRKTDLTSAHATGCGCATCTGGTVQRTAIEDAHTAGCGCVQCKPAKSIQRTMSKAVLSAATVQRLHKTPTPTVQRHGSAEHMLMGDTKPSELAQAANGKVKTENRIHVLEQELTRVCNWHTAGVKAITEKMGTDLGVKMVKVGATNPIWITYGEMNAMPDYVPNPDAVLQGDGEHLGQFVQHIRYDSSRWIKEQVVRIIDEERATIKPIRYDVIDSGDGPPIHIPVYSEADEQRLAALNRLQGRQASTTTSDKWEKATNVARAVNGTAAAAAETKGLDAKTANSGSDKYTNLLGRNACHFVPFSWDRWFQFHNEAKEDAKRANEAGNETDKKNLLNTARIKNGYADHFLQDSYAAGHLINKTLVMQWYVEWMETKYAAAAQDYMNSVAQSRGNAADASSQWGQQTQDSWSQGADNSSQWGKDVQENWSGWGYGLGNVIGLGARAIGGTMWGAKEAVGLGARTAGGIGWGANKLAQGGSSLVGGMGGAFMPGEWDQVRQMTPTKQPGLAGMNLYNGPLRHRGPHETSDPQTAEEEATKPERMAKSGVQGGNAAYDNYLAFLKKGCIQLVTNRLHNDFCENGLEVKNGNDQGFKVYGDYTLLTTGSEVAKGVEIAVTAAQMSQQAIEDMASTGNTANTPDKIFKLFPQKVKHPVGGAEYSMADWHDGAMPNALKAYAISKIFEPMWQLVWNNTSKFTDMDQISQDYPNPHPQQGF